MSFTVDGLSKGDWTEVDIFFRGAGDIIGATKIDEEILAEMLREEEADTVDVDHEPDDDEASVDTQEIVQEEAVNEDTGPMDAPDQGWFGVGRGEEE